MTTMMTTMTTMTTMTMTTMTMTIYSAPPAKLNLVTSPTVPVRRPAPPTGTGVAVTWSAVTPATNPAVTPV
jgi:hypothetical protein